MFEFHGKVATITVCYLLMVIVFFGLVSAQSKDVCEERAHDPMQCRVGTAIPAAIFWPFTAAYGIGDFFVSD